MNPAQDWVPAYHCTEESKRNIFSILWHCLLGSREFFRMHLQCFRNKYIISPFLVKNIRTAFQLTQADNKQNATTASWYNSLVWKWQGIQKANNVKRKNGIKHEAQKCIKTHAVELIHINYLLSASYPGINWQKL